MSDPMEETPGKRALLARVLPFLALAALVAVLFSPFLLKGWVLDGNHDRRDLVIPFHILHQRALEQGTLPHWNPYIFCGKNAHGSAVYPSLYPPYWPAYLLGEENLPASLTVVLLVHVLLGAWFAFLFFRRLSGQEYWALLGAMVYLLSSASVMQMTAGTVNYAAWTWLPLLLFLAAGSHERGLAGNVALQAVVVALLMLGTNPQLAVYSLAIYLAWSLWRSWEKSSRTPVLSALAATALGAGLSCLRYVPFYFAMKAQGGPALAFDVFRSRYLTEPGHLLRLFTPEIFGARLHLEVEGGINHFEIFSAYVGVPCALAALFILISCWNRRTAFFNLLTLAILLILLGTPLLYVHYYGLAKMEIMYNRLAWFLPLGFGALFAVGAEEVFLHRKKPFFAFSVGVLALVAALAWLLVSRSFTPEFREAVRPEIRFSLLHFLALGLASLLVFSLAGKRVLFKALLTVLVLADLLAVASIESNNSHPFFSPMPLFRFCDEAKMVAEKMERERHPHRILSVPWLSRTNPRGPYTPNNQYLALGLYNSSGYDNQSPRLLSQLYRHPGEGGRVLDRQILPFTDRMVRLSSSGYCTDGARVWVHEDALKRWGLYTKYEVRAPGAETLDLLVSSEFSWPGTLVLDQEPDLPIRPRAGPGGFTILEQGRNRLAVQVAAPENALFLVNDSRDPGWTAVQDGRPAPILAANHAFMALEVPAGVHTLEMSFTPQGWRAGLAVSLFAILALAATAFAAFRPRRLPAKISWEFASTPPSL